MDKLMCDDCGTIGNAKEMQCPYQSDVNNTKVQAILCEDCYYERCMDI